MIIIRWILFLPLALLVAIVGNLLFGLGFIGVGLQNQIFLNGVSGFIFSFLLVFSAGIFAPSRHAVVAICLGGVLTLLAILSFVLAILGVHGFVERVMPDRLSIPVLQILGALYAVFLVPCFIVPGATLERFWQEVIALGTVVVIFGLILSTTGVIIGIVTRIWTTFAVGGIVMGMGITTWFFPYVHLFLRARRIRKE